MTTRGTIKFSGKEALLAWCSLNTEDYKINITDFDSSWRNGEAFLAILHRFRPDLFEEDLDKLLADKNVQKNLSLAFEVAQKLNIPQLITAEEVLDKSKPLDQNSIVTYVSHFYKLFNEQNPVERKREKESNEPLCKRCRKPLTGATVKFERFIYHQKCFECTQCGKQLSGKVVKLNRAPYCELCGKQTWTATIREKSQAKESEDKRREMQQKAFTVWINHHLKQELGESSPQVENLNSDLSSGVLLIELIASVYKLKKPNYNKKPTLYAHYLDNVSIALKMLETAGIKMPFLKAQNIVDGNVKMLYGLLWQLVLDSQIGKLPKDPNSINLTEDDSAKQTLMKWVKDKLTNYKDVKIDDFSSSWKDGTGFLALVHSHKPDLFDFSKIDPKSKEENLKMAFDLAEKNLGIPKLLDPQDMLNVTKPDERSIIVYISEFVHYYILQLEKKTQLPSQTSNTVIKVVDEVIEEEESIDELPISNVNSFNWEEVRADGYLYKQDVGWFRFWKKKWFSLQGSRLLYWKDKESISQPPDSIISIAFAKSVEHNKAKQNSFMIVTENRVYYLQADTPGEKDKWFKSLTLAIDIWKQRAEQKQDMTNTKLKDIVPTTREYKEGYLYDQNFLYQWRSSFFVLKDGILFRYGNKGEAQADRLPLYGCTIETYADPQFPDVCFKIVARDLRTWCLRAESEKEMHEWLNNVLRQRVIIEEFINSIITTEEENVVV